MKKFLRNLSIISLLSSSVIGCGVLTSNLDANRHTLRNDVSLSIVDMKSIVEEEFNTGNAEIRLSQFKHVPKGNATTARITAEFVNSINPVTKEKTVEAIFKIVNGPKLTYKLGEYILDKDNLDPISQAFFDTIVRIVRRLDAKAKEYGKELELHARYYGSADYYPVGSIHYKSEMRDLEISLTHCTLNGVPTSFSITNDTDIHTNAELAFIRAAIVASIVDYMVKPIEIKTNYEISTSLEANQKGNEYRFVKMAFQIRDPNK